jgi:nitrate reductase delta subunit
LKTFRALAALLAYPDENLVTGLEDIASVLSEERQVPDSALAPLHELVRELAAGDLYGLQESYVALFDRSRALSLNLFEHVHGESRDRGQAMVDLAGLYATRGLQVLDHELPDYLPAFLEYCSLLDAERAKALLGDAASILRSLGEGLARRDSRYAAVFEALLALAGEQGIGPQASAPEIESAQAMDREWAEEPVTFGGGCGAQATAQPVRMYRKGIPA